MVSLLDNAPSFQRVNYSVPRLDPVDGEKELQEALRNQIRPVHVVIILAGMYMNHSGWIESEMDFSDQIGKPMIGARPWGKERVPVEVQLRVKEVAGWNTTSVVAAIRRHVV